MRADTSGNFALFDNATVTDAGATLFRGVQELIEARRADEVIPALRAIEAAAARGLHVAGYCAYELGYVFEPRLRHMLREDGQPLLRFQAFSQRTFLSAGQRALWLHEKGARGIMRAPRILEGLTADEHARKVQRVRDLIGAGDVYQVNLTFRLALEDCPDSFSLYAHLREASRAGGCAFLHFGDEDVLSFSPELFFTTRGNRISARPMKGTAPRAPDADSDAWRRIELSRDEKQQAENLMIVDLIRNDLSRVAEPGTVCVSDLFTVETYPRFHTLTSGIDGSLVAGTSLHEMMAALFPCGSVTGAPKIRAMEIISALEDEPRGVYCGAIGVVGPDGMSFNVAIRSLTLREGRGYMGTGGGIVWDSQPEAEYQECLLKASFLTHPNEPFRLIETLRWDPAGGFHLINRHLKRLAASSRHFGFRFSEEAILRGLELAVRSLSEATRVRLTLGPRGDLQTECSPLGTQGTTHWTVTISPDPMSSLDWRVYHKTTCRAIYDEPLRQMQAIHRCDEVLFTNERGELTEGSRSSLFLERQGVWYTPPLSSGLLDGCLRREMIENGPQRVVEHVLRPSDLSTGSLWLGNSVRGLIPAQLCGLAKKPSLA